MHSRYRTTDPAEATLFFVPLYLSLFCRAKYANLQAREGLGLAASPSPLDHSQLLHPRPLPSPVRPPSPLHPYP